MAHQVVRQRVFEHSSALKRLLWACNILNGGIRSFMKSCKRHLETGNLLFNRMDIFFYSKILSTLLPHGNNELLMLAWAHETTPEPNFSDEDQDRIDPPFNHSHGIDNYGYAIVEQMMDFAPRIADSGGLAATSSGFYGTTPDANPMIDFDANLDNLIHAAGFSGHGFIVILLSFFMISGMVISMANRYGQSPCVG